MRTLSQKLNIPTFMGLAVLPVPVIIGAIRACRLGTNR